MPYKDKEKQRAAQLRSRKKRLAESPEYRTKQKQVKKLWRLNNHEKVLECQRNYRSSQRGKESTKRSNKRYKKRFISKLKENPELYRAWGIKRNKKIYGEFFDCANLLNELIIEIREIKKDEKRFNSIQFETKALGNAGISKIKED